MSSNFVNERRNTQKIEKLKTSIKLMGVVTILSASAVSNYADAALLGNLLGAVKNTVTNVIQPANNAPDAAAPAVNVPTSLALEKVPEPANLSEFVRNKTAAIALGKALFWEMRVGSDGMTSCASCHFHAGVDTRIKNSLGPAHERIGYHSSKPNDVLSLNDFPLTQFSDVTKNDKNESPIKDVRDVVSSQGVIKTGFLNVIPGKAEDQRDVLADEVFNVAGINTRRVEPRNVPTVINSVFNLRNFWDGRAQTIFNGVSPFGKRDTEARVYKTVLGRPVPVEVTINDASLASLSSGPPESELEMSSIGRRLSDIGKKVIPMRMLADQKVQADDSVLGVYRDTSGFGLKATYKQAIESAFKPEWWNSNRLVNVNGKNYSQMEANFSLIFGLSVQLYQATLVSDKTRFDSYAEGNSNALTSQEQLGYALFMSKGKCVSCHGGPVFTSAAIKRKNELGKTTRINSMIMGNNQLAAYDEGFYNIGVTRSQDDIGVGGLDPFGNPLSFSRLAATGKSNFYWKELDYPNVEVGAGDRVAVDGALKTPTLRNIALTAPYMHNGGYATLRSVVEFYNRGGNFPKNNFDDLDADIEPLGLSESEIDALVAFMGTLTDERVEKHAGPFDHPELVIPHGHVGDTYSVASTTSEGANGTFAKDEALVIPAVGKNGYLNNEVKSFLNIKQVP